MLAAATSDDERLAVRRAILGAAIEAMAHVDDSGGELGQHFRPEQLDGVEVSGVRHAADVHLQDLSGVAEQAVQVEDALGDLVRAAGEDHAAGLELLLPPGR